MTKRKVGVGQISDLLKFIATTKDFFGVDKNTKSTVMIRQSEYFKYQHCAELYEHLQKYDLSLEIAPLKLTPINENYTWLEREKVRIDAITKLLNRIEMTDNEYEHSTELYKHLQKRNLPLEITPLKLTKL